jgi:thiol:disulfide interchange protein
MIYPTRKLWVQTTWLLLVITCLFISCQKNQQVKKRKTQEVVSLVNWVKTEKLSEVVDQAIIENKLVFLNIVTDWCVPCKMMDQDVFTHKVTSDYLNKNFVNYKVNAEKANGPDLKYLYQVTHIPTLIFLDHKGRILVKHEGAAYHSKLKALADEAILQSG